MWCQNCHDEFAGSFVFCPNCGTPSSLFPSSKRQAQQMKFSVFIRVALIITIILVASGIITAGIVFIRRPGTPANNQINPVAAAMITSATSTDAIVTSSSEPIGQIRDFKVGSIVYITVTFSGHMGYTVVKLYRDSIPDIDSRVLAVHNGDTNGVFSFHIDHPGQFVAGVYWCGKGDCSDQVLAQVVNFSAS
jgi:hypothetical protein